MRAAERASAIIRTERLVSAATSASVGSRPSSTASRRSGLRDLALSLDHVHRHADRALLVLDRTLDRLADPPGRVGGELEPAPPVELLRAAHQAQHALLDAVEQGQLLAAVLLRDADDQAQVRGHHPLARVAVATLDALRELHLLLRREQGEAAQLSQEEAERVRRGAGQARRSRTGPAPERRGRSRPELDAALPRSARTPRRLRGRRGPALSISSLTSDSSRQPESRPCSNRIWNRSSVASCLVLMIIVLLERVALVGLDADCGGALPDSSAGETAWHG